MSNKHLDENEIVNELKGSSLFFQREPESPPAPKPEAQPIPKRQHRSEMAAPVETQEFRNPPPRHKSQIHKAPSDENEASPLSTSNASDPASMLARHPDSLIEEIRKTVKATGKEVSFVRLTPEEKHLLVDIVYTYKRQGVRTSENEINRIAVNYLLLDYQVNGADSILTRVIKALLA